MKRKKICSLCGENKWNGQFYRNPKTGLLSSWCKECGRIYKREEYRRNRKKPDGVRVDPETGRKLIHNGCSVKVYWDGNMLSIMKRHFPTTLNEEMLELLGGVVSMRTMLRKARELGLEKNKEWLRGIWEERRIMADVASKKKGYPGGFKKGHEFWGNQNTGYFGRKDIV